MTTPRTPRTPREIRDDLREAQQRFDKFRPKENFKARWENQMKQQLLKIELKASLGYWIKEVPS